MSRAAAFLHAGGASELVVIPLLCSARSFPLFSTQVFKIRSVERGRCTPQLQRKTLMGKFLAKEECSFAVLGR